jgi:WD40 repeat protein
MVEQAEIRFDLFVSYAEADSAWVEGYLLDALTRAGVRCHSEAAFALGVPHLLEFEHAVRHSRRILLILSPAYLAEGASQFTELLAQSYGLETTTWPVIPLIMHPVELPSRLAMLTALDATDPDSRLQVLKRLLADLRRPLPPPPEKPPPPYPGMKPFEKNDARYFFGRDAEIDDMLRRLHHQQRFLVVFGDSGSGKSSLINAGLLPRLSESTLFPADYWLVRTMSPGSQPLETLAQRLGADLAEPAKAVTDLLAANAPAQRLLLVIDQFEELFTQASSQDRAEFIQVLQAVRAIEFCTLVLALRGDFFYYDLKGTNLWPETFSERLEIDPLRGEALRDAIEKPAAREGVYLEPVLVERLIADAAEERGALPLVQETMFQLWDKMERRFISLNAYRRLGGGERSGLAGALVTFANTTLDALVRRSPQHETIAHRIFLRLVQFGEGREDTRRQQPKAALCSWDDTEEVFDETLQYLAENRLLTLSGEEEDKDRKVDIAHEALFTEWPALKELVRVCREPEQMRRRLEDWATIWVNREQDPKALLNPVELSRAEEWLSSPEADELGYSTPLRDLVKASKAAQDAETARQAAETARQATARRFRLGALTAILLLIIAVLAAVAVEERRLTQEQEKAVATAEAFGQEKATLAAQEQAARQRAEGLAKDAFVRQVLAKSESLLDNRYDQSLLLSIQAFRLADTTETRNNLLRALRAWPRLVRYVPDSDAPRAIAFSPDGETLVAVTLSGIRLWDASTGAAIDPTSTVIGGSTVSSRDGKVGFSAESNTILAWGLASNEPPRWLGGKQTSGWPEVLSSDGKIKASWLGDGAIALQDVDTGKQVGMLRDGRLGGGYRLTFSANSRMLAAASALGEDPPAQGVMAWELPPSLTDYVKLHDEMYETSDEADNRWAWFGDKNTDAVGNVTNLVFSPDGQFLAATVQRSENVHYRLRMGEKGDQNYDELWRREPDLTSLASDCSGSYAWGTEDGTITTIDRPNHPGPVEALAFSPDCSRMASLGGGTIVLWDLKAKSVPPLFELVDTRSAMDYASMAAWNYSGAISWSSPDGKSTASSKCSRRFVEFEPDSPCVESAIDGGFAGFTGIVTSLARSPDGETLAAGVCTDYDYHDNNPKSCFQSEVWLWPGGPDEAVHLDSYEAAVTDLVFSSDGKVLAVVYQDGAADFWDVDVESIIADACYKVGRNLTDTEWTALTGSDQFDRPGCPSTERPDPNRWAATLKQLEPLLAAPRPTITPWPTRTSTPTRTPRPTVTLGSTPTSMPTRTPSPPVTPGPIRTPTPTATPRHPVGSGG